MGVTKLVCELYELKAKLSVFLADHIVAMVAFYATKLNATYIVIIGQILDTMSSTNIQRL